MPEPQLFSPEDLLKEDWTDLPNLGRRVPPLTQAKAPGAVVAAPQIKETIASPTPQPAELPEISDDPQDVVQPQAKPQAQPTAAPRAQLVKMPAQSGAVTTGPATLATSGDVKGTGVLKGGTKGGYHPDIWDPVLDKIAQDTGVDPRLLKAIARQENVAAGDNNPLGVSPGGGGPTHYASVEEGAAGMRDYVLKHLPHFKAVNLDDPKTVQNFAAWYSPAGASNDPYGTNVTEGAGIINAARQMMGAGAEQVQTFAQGGVVTEPTLAVIGEAGPEAVVPLGDTGAVTTGGRSGQGRTNPPLQAYYWAPVTQPIPMKPTPGHLPGPPPWGPDPESGFAPSYIAPVLAPGENFDPQLAQTDLKALSAWLERA
jgi:hypothetical protein